MIVNKICWNTCHLKLTVIKFQSWVSAFLGPMRAFIKPEVSSRKVKVEVTIYLTVILFQFICKKLFFYLGLCYAEFGARVPKAGSAYAYSYVCVGEFIAFLMGWNLILEYVIGTASVVKGFSLYLDQLLGKSMERTFTRLFPMSIPNFSKYPDFFSFGITLLFSRKFLLLHNNCTYRLFSLKIIRSWSTLDYKHLEN